MLMLDVCVEVFKRYILERADGLDLRRQQHDVRHAVHAVRRLHARAGRPRARRLPLRLDSGQRTQAALDLALYIAFFLPGIAALLYAGWGYAGDSWRINEHSTDRGRTAGVPFKTVIPIAVRSCCCRASPRSCAASSACAPAVAERLKDAEEIDVVEQQLATSTLVDEESRSAPSTTCTRSTRPRGRAAWARTPSYERCMSDPALGLTMLALIVVVIMMGFPTAFTLMGLGHDVRLRAFYDPSQPWTQNASST
jgi:hypothetical protein